MPYYHPENFELERGCREDIRKEYCPPEPARQLTVEEIEAALESRKRIKELASKIETLFLRGLEERGVPADA